MKLGMALPSNEERAMLRESVRGFLEQHWPVEHAVVRTAEPAAVGTIRKRLVAQGVASLLEILGMRASLSQGAADNLDNGRFEQGLRHALMWVISIGTNEIQRSLIAQRALGLPR